ncbi:MAG: DUF4363 family protein [Ruminococcus sp.]|nr:DUF4363 family protein [Ruminococcus sp.]
MNRAVICALLLFMIGAACTGSLIATDQSTDRLTALVDKVEEACLAGDTGRAQEAVDDLEEYWDGCRKWLSLAVQAGPLGDISYGIARLRFLCLSEPADAAAECRGIRRLAELIRENQIPLPYSLL